MNAPANLPVISRLSSPILQGFELNPFRVLRLRVDATTNAAAFQAENALTLSRVGLSLDDPDVLPWLPQPEPHYLQQAAQSIEEPLIRLKNQLLWFDLVADPQAGVLEAALREPPGNALQRYMDAEAALPACPTEGEKPPADYGAVAHAINQANVRLLAASAALDGRLFATPDGGAKARPITKAEWKALGGLPSLMHAHASLVVGQLAISSRFNAEQCWREAFKRWVALLDHPWFVAYLEKCIAGLDDDFVSADDIETVKESIKAQLADLSVQETRYFLLEGRYEPLRALIAALADAGMEPTVLTPAMRPLRQVFQSELAELDSLLEQSQQESLEYFRAYLNRLDAIRSRWLNFDAQGIIGLRDLLDEAAEKAYLKLKQQDKPGPDTEALLNKADNIASARSLKEKLKTFRTELREARERICEFCHSQDPDYAKSAILRGRIETSRDSGFTSTTIHYTIRFKSMLRCARCARFHDFLSEIGILIIGTLIATLGVFLVVSGNRVNLGAILIAIVVCGVVYLRVPLFWDSIFHYSGAALAYVSRLPFALLLTPKSHRRIGDYKGSKAASDLSGHRIKPDWRSDAIARIDKKGRLNVPILLPLVAFVLNMVIAEPSLYEMVADFYYSLKLSAGVEFTFEPLSYLPIPLTVAFGLWGTGFVIGRTILAAVLIYLGVGASAFIRTALVALLFTTSEAAMATPASIVIGIIEDILVVSCVVGSLAALFRPFRKYEYAVPFIAYFVGGDAIGQWLMLTGYVYQSSAFLFAVVQVPAFIALGLWVRNAGGDRRTPSGSALLATG